MQSHFWDNVNIFFKLSPNVISIAYVILIIPQDEPSRCCITFAYISSRCLTLIILINNCTISSGKFSFSVCLNHILCNVSLLWLHVYEQNANGCYLWKCVVNIWINIYVWFLWLHMCVVGILAFLIFEHITFALLLPYVGHSTICKDLGHFHHLLIIVPIVDNIIINYIIV